MLQGFETDDEIKAKAAMIIYVIYRSRDRSRGPSGLDMWGQIERYARSSAKRATGVADFVATFKRKMACSTINPHWMQQSGATSMVMLADGSFVTRESDQRNFGLEIFDPESEEENREIVECIYTKTQIVILLVRDRLEREKTFADLED